VKPGLNAIDVTAVTKETIETIPLDKFLE